MRWLRRILESWFTALSGDSCRSRILERAGSREQLPQALQGLHDRLQQVPWGDLRECYGPADTVPVLLLELAGPDEEIREEAYHALTARIWHQNTIYEASAHAVPFLVEMAQSPDVPERWRSVQVLALLAGGRGYSQVHTSRRGHIGDARYEEELRTEARQVAAVKAQLRAHVTEFDAWKEDPDPLVRRFALELTRELGGA